MKTSLLVSCIMASVFCFFLFEKFFCAKEKPETQFEQKGQPDETYFQQRAYPDGKFSVEKYSAGLQQAKWFAKHRTIDAFDESWIQQGPGNIGGRINTLAVHPQNESIIYAGFAVGGIFKTSDGGLNWEPLFDDQPFLAISDIALDPNNPEIVYAGTGDHNNVRYPFIGDGIYRSMDGGNSWDHLGLTDQRIISKIIIDPSDTDILYVSCMGLPFEKNTDRGLYKSVDGGSSWDQVLFLSDSTGVIDMLINPQNPQVLYAAGWDRMRNNTEWIQTGAGARIYKTNDGGENWSMLEGGLPNSIGSRIGLTMSGTDPEIIFAAIVGSDHTLDGIYKTTNGGLNWSPIPTGDQNGLVTWALGTYGWYFGRIEVNPNNDNDIFLLGIWPWRTQNGGDNWDWWVSPVPGSVAWSQSPDPPLHWDIHDLVFLPSGNIITATDGGLYRSEPLSAEWEKIENIPASQFYRVAYNPHQPALYYGGTQDNGSIGGNAEGIDEWQRIAGGDGFTMIFDPFNPARFFVETQRGDIYITENSGFTFQDADSGIDVNDRRNWDMPYIMSPHNPNELYAGTHRVYKGLGVNPQWTPISEDLSDGDSEPHSFHNISTLDESPLLSGLLYAGTGDGNVWRKDETTTDWVSIAVGLPDQYVTDVKSSIHQPDVVFVTHSGYRDNEFIPHIHRSDDRGETWIDISSNLPELAINDLLILPGYADSILFVATDGGVFGTLDSGNQWERVGNNMPLVAVFDLAHHPLKNELIAGTYARSLMTFPIDSLLQDIAVSQQEPIFSQRGEMNIYPNPVVNYLTIDFGNIEPGQQMEIIIINSEGRVAYQFNGQVPNMDKRIPLSMLNAGIYFIKIKIRDQVYMESFIKLN